jgi:hypothetical protein
MTIEEIFNQMARHMVEGLMMHSQLTEYYNFLGLEGYSKCQCFHYFEENKNYKKICKYYMKHFNKLINEGRVDSSSLIPETWFRYTRQDVTSTNRKTFIQNGFEKWVEWETETKKLYETFYTELVALGEIAAALEIKKYIEDVDEELAEACQKNLELKIIDYDIVYILDEQEQLFKKYKKALKELEL